MLPITPFRTPFPLGAKGETYELEGLVLCAAIFADVLPAPDEVGAFDALIVLNGTVRGTTSTRNSRLSRRATAFADDLLVCCMVIHAWKKSLGHTTKDLVQHKLALLSNCKWRTDT